jgi:hypothetical protein
VFKEKQSRPLPFPVDPDYGTMGEMIACGMKYEKYENESEKFYV